jgi:DNA repair protein RadC
VPPHQQVSPVEALALLLTGGNPGTEILRRAQAAVRSGPGLRGLLQPLVAHSAAESALSASERAHLLALRALLAHWTAEPVERGRPFTCGQDFFEAYHLRLRDLKQEVFLVVQLDQKNHLIGDDQISLGTLSETLVHPREVFANALARRAAAVALIHNHPSGDPTPSTADCDITKRLNTVAKIIGIRLLDHIVIGDGRFTSFVETGIMP